MGNKADRLIIDAVFPYAGWPGDALRSVGPNSEGNCVPSSLNLRDTRGTQV